MSEFTIYVPTLVDDIHLSDDFLETYRNRQPKWGFDGLGWVVFLRTYARKKSDGTLEQWWETVRRFTEGNFQIEAQRAYDLGVLTREYADNLVTEMQRFYHLAFNLVLTPPGRGVWISGTDYEKRSGDALNNCWYVSMRPQPYAQGEDPKVSFAPAFTFDQAMKGGGVGVSVQRKHVDLVPKVTSNVQLGFRISVDHPDLKEIEDTLTALGYAFQVDDDTLEVYFYRPGQHEMYFDPNNRYRRNTTDDSREGWVHELTDVIDSHYESQDTNLTIDLTQIRPRGSEIKGFGGVASGPAPLAKMLVLVNDVLNNRLDDYVTPVEWGDVIQLIGTCVVAGNVRRTALILIGDQDDKEFVESKDYSKPKNRAASQWRWASNNSVDISADTPRRKLRKIAENIYNNGEPGVVNIGLAQNYGRIADGLREAIDILVEGFNPCGEITLPNASPCNLFEISLPRIHELIAKGYESESLYAEAVRLGVRYAYRVTFRSYDWQATRDIVEQHRRVGVGITGFADWVLLKFGQRAVLGFDENGDPIYNQEVTDLLDEMYSQGRLANNIHSLNMRANASIKITTVKPSGTMSLLMGVSPGMHWHWSAYMIRRVRMAANSQLADICLQCGYDVEYAQTGTDAEGNPKYDYTTVVVSFPTKAPTADHPEFLSEGEVSLAEQAATQALLGAHWADNSVSCTLKFHRPKPEPVFFSDGLMMTDRFNNPVMQVDARKEARVIEEITDVLDRYKGTIKSTSLLPYDDSTYPQMPYQAITKARYEAMVAKITAKPWELMGQGILADNSDLDESTECVGGHCPVR